MAVFLMTISPCIVIFEDFDSYGYSRKNGELETFLNIIDNSKININAVYIASINNSKSLNYSLLRTGRFDEVKEIKEPTNNEEIYFIMKFHYEKFQKTFEHYKDKPFINSLSWLTCYRLKKYKLAQSDYVELILKLMLMKKDINEKTIIESRNNILHSKKMVKKYKREDDE
jgi:SpoVK/Ycf46/Vps4 family AAA+-type ATPase